ncbi:VOC family protein [Mycolicibacterium sediminis]|uniref:Glyoxalase n=1 Tax=Mycolicibacterium sediminis TaxID=1286180 RepID=A0A7I7QQP7_9MYCO|nr:VOC family protein [Mycolicibacterium sediminis]BBY28277.1 glyoxalase [Mycolicibacterium sediminis]
MNDGHDPLAVLHGGDLPVHPDPDFAARLRARLESALSLPNRTGDVDMSGTDTALAELTGSATATVPRAAMLPYLTVADARAAIDWYVDALGATRIGDPITMDDGRIGHAELALSGGVFYLADEFPESGLTAPATRAVSVSLMLAVPDTDAALRRADERGATVEREPYEAHGSRTATIVDPFGHRWMLSGPQAGAPVPIQHGDVGFVSVWTPDADRAAAFYGQVLGWTVDPDTREVTNATQRIGLFSVAGDPTMLCCYAVSDLDGARRAIVDAGGRVGRTTEFDVGTVLDATDPSGAPFAVVRPAPGTPRPALNGSGPGEVSYLTYQVPDSSSFREFYSRTLNWTFQRGRVDDGWEVEGTHPMAGIAGGFDRSVVVPMWTVPDVEAAVERVRAAGGTVLEEPSRQSYGMSALCIDDQGSRFYLGEV